MIYEYEHKGRNCRVIAKPGCTHGFICPQYGLHLHSSLESANDMLESAQEDYPDDDGYAVVELREMPNLGKADDFLRKLTRSKRKNMALACRDYSDEDLRELMEIATGIGEALGAYLKGKS